MLQRVSVLVLLCAVVPLRAESAQEALARVGAVWASGDAARFAEVLAPSFPRAGYETLRMKGRFRGRCLVVQSVTAALATAATARATGTLTFHIVEMPRGAGTRELVEDVHVALARTAEGKWEVVHWKPDVDAIAERLAAADADLLGILRDAFTHRDLVRAITRQAVEMSNVSRTAQAKKLAAIAALLAAETGDEAAVASAAWAELVTRDVFTQDPAKRQERVQEILVQAVRSRDPDVIAVVQGLAGRVQLDVDESSREAERIFLDLIARDAELSEPSILARTAHHAGITRFTRGNYRGALELFHLSLDRSLATGDSQGAAWTRLHVGRIFDRQNDLALALTEYRKALDAVTPGTIPEALIRQAMARSLRRSGRKEEAAKEEQAALALSRALGRPGLVANALVAISESALLAGNADAAAAHAAEAVSQARKVAYRPAEIDALLTLAEIERSRGRYEEALAWTEEVRRLDAKLEDLGFALPAALMLAARCHHALGDAEEETRALREAIRHIEHFRTLVAGDDRQLRLFFQDHSAAYTMMAAAAARAGDVDEVLAYAERGRARVLFDLLERGAVGSSGVSGGDSPRVTREDLRRMLEPGTLLLEYVIGEERTQLIAIRLDNEAVPRITVHVIPAGRGELERRTGDLVRRIAGRDLHYRAAAKELYALLLGPVEREVAGAKLLGICADGPLWSLPFETLVGSDGTFLTERMATFYMPSISAYRALRERVSPSRRTVLVVADAPARRTAAPLPDAREEASALAAIYGRDRTVLRVGTAATERAVKKDAGTFSILHFAVHGVLDDRDPMYSHIVLGGGRGENGALEAWEIAGLPLRAELVVLSACDTGRGRVYAGEGLVGMSWALLVAGSRSAVVSHWAVSSRVTKQFMVEFHRRYHASGAKAESLRQARLATLRNHATRHPFYWSAFVLMGP